MPKFKSRRITFHSTTLERGTGFDAEAGKHEAGTERLNANAEARGWRRRRYHQLNISVRIFCLLFAFTSRRRRYNFQVLPTRTRPR